MRFLTETWLVFVRGMRLSLRNKVWLIIGLMQPLLYLALFGPRLAVALGSWHAVFGLALLGIEVSAWAAAALALTLYTSAYLVEIWRGCVEAVPRGQWEAARSLALSFGEQLRHVILPQAGRLAIAPTVGLLVQVIKGTALASVIGFIELTKAGSMIANASFKPFLVFGCVALLYFALCFPISLFAQRLEARHVR